MDWVKIYGKHLHGLSLMLKGALISLEVLCAHLEKIPTEKQMLIEVPEKTLNLLKEALQERSTSLQDVFDKVLEDVTKLERGRKRGFGKSSNFTEEFIDEGLEDIQKMSKNVKTSAIVVAKKKPD